MARESDCCCIRKWEEVDHDLEDSLAGNLTRSGPGGGDSEPTDPLGLGRPLECVCIPIHLLCIQRD